MLRNRATAESTVTYISHRTFRKGAIALYLQIVYNKEQYDALSIGAVLGGLRMKNHLLKVSGKDAHEINRDMIGLFFEDINFAADGGLYAELLENRSFEAVLSKGVTRNYVFREDSLYAWSLLPGDGVMEISMNMSLSEKNPHYLRFTAKKAGDGFANKAYDGLSLKKGMQYNISFYAREEYYQEGDIEICLTKDGACCGAVTVPFCPIKAEPDGYKVMVGDCEAKTWKKYEAVITASADVNGASFEVHLTKPGVVEFDLFSMIPEDAVAGTFRKDLFEALFDLHPGFLRFPGGCIVEGTSLRLRYRWKDTVGPLPNRKINTNLWATQGGNTTYEWEMPDSHYMQSYGIGFYEYFVLCELLSTAERRCLPLPVLNIGVACQFRSYETVPVDSPEFEEYVQDALDLIEFANGPVTSKWGSLRARMGHPESFKLTMIAIGNEQWESRHVDVAPRYIRFEKAIHEVYPDIRCLGTAGPFINGELYDKAWEFYRAENRKNPDFSYAVDEHYYVAPQWLYDNVGFYDNYPRDTYVFAGEYAAHDANQSNSVEAGLAEAAMITGMERNGDLVKLASYAPLFNRIGHSHWTPDMIWFDAEQVVLTPSYYVQKIFSNYAGQAALALDGQEKALRDDQLYISLVRDGASKILKVVNGSTEEQAISSELLTGNAEIATLRAASGMAKVPVPTKAVANENNHAVPLSVVSNRELCELRGPEPTAYTVTEEALNGSYVFPAKSLVAIKLK